MRTSDARPRRVQRPLLRWYPSDSLPDRLKLEGGILQILHVLARAR